MVRLDADHKRHARLNCISHFLSLIPYKEIPREKVTLPKRQKPDGYEEPQRPVRRVPKVSTDVALTDGSEAPRKPIALASGICARTLLIEQGHLRGNFLAQTRERRT